MLWTDATRTPALRLVPAQVRQFHQAQVPEHTHNFSRAFFKFLSANHLKERSALSLFERQKEARIFWRNECGGVRNEADSPAQYSFFPKSMQEKKESCLSTFLCTNVSCFAISHITIPPRCHKIHMEGGFTFGKVAVQEKPNLGKCSKVVEQPAGDVVQLLAQMGERD